PSHALSGKRGLRQPPDRNCGWQNTHGLGHGMKKLLLLGIMLTAGHLHSQAQDTLLLNFEEAVEIGLQSNQTYRIRQNEQDLLNMEKKAPTAAFFPNVNINNSFSQQSGEQSQLVEGEYIFTTISNQRISSGLSAELPIYS